MEGDTIFFEDYEMIYPRLISPLCFFFRRKKKRLKPSWKKCVSILLVLYIKTFPEDITFRKFIRQKVMIRLIVRKRRGGLIEDEKKKK